MKIRTLLTVCTTLWFAVTAVMAGTTGKIAGVVKDSKTGEPIIGANVLIEGTTMGAATNFEGYYVILNIRPGEHSVSVSAIGYIKKTTTGLNVSVDLTTTVDMVLDQTVVELGQEVVVTAERPVIQKDLTSSEARVGADEIRSLPVREVREVLALQSGITVDRNGGIHIRGGRTNEVAYWVDGVSLSDVYDGGQAVQVDNKSVQELQVISGTYNAEYGQSMSGVVNIVTKDGDQDLRGSVTAYSADYYTTDMDIFTGPPTLLSIRELTRDANVDRIQPFDTRNIEASLSGPVPGLSDLTFYASVRYLRSGGWLYGNRSFVPRGTDSLKSSSGTFLGFRGDGVPVAMNDRERFSGQAKLTYQFSPSVKLSVSGLWSRIDYHDYNHDWRMLPDGDVRKFERGLSGNALWTHTLGATSFYTINASYFLKDFKENLYEYPFDPRYIIDPEAQGRGIREFIHRGTNLHHFKRKTETRVAKIDYTDQVNKLHLLKLGTEGKIHRLYLEDYNVTPLAVTGGYTPIIPDPTTDLYQEYTEKPFEVSAYVQDKLEYDRMIVNVGVRFDYFDSRGKILADPLDPNVYLPQKVENKNLTLAQRLEKWYKNVLPKHSVSPRFGISYPITDRGALHFSYGHFVQIPSFQYLYQKPGYKVGIQGGVQGVFGNPDLNPQKTVMYEFGLQQSLSDVLNFDVTGFYRDIRDWVSTSAQIPVRDPVTATTWYTIFVNRDYANARGVTFTLDKRMSDMFSVNLSYTFQIAEGANSNPDEEQAQQAAGPGAGIQPEKSLVPLEWDQTHTANLSVGIGQENWGAFVLARYGSGLPYSPVINQAAGRGEDVARLQPKNSRRRPASYTIDLQIFKDFELVGSTDVRIFLKVFNLFDRRNEIEVYGETGRAAATPEALGIGAVTGERVNTVQEFLVRPDFYSEPREIQLGLELSF